VRAGGIRARYGSGGAPAATAAGDERYRALDVIIVGTGGAPGGGTLATWLGRRASAIPCCSKRVAFPAPGRAKMGTPGRGSSTAATSRRTPGYDADGPARSTAGSTISAPAGGHEDGRRPRLVFFFFFCTGAPATSARFRHADRLSPAVAAELTTEFGWLHQGTKWSLYQVHGASGRGPHGGPLVPRSVTYRATVSHEPRMYSRSDDEAARRRHHRCCAVRACVGRGGANTPSSAPGIRMHHVDGYPCLVHAK